MNEGELHWPFINLSAKQLLDTNKWAVSLQKHRSSVFAVCLSWGLLNADICFKTVWEFLGADMKDCKCLLFQRQQEELFMRCEVMPQTLCACARRRLPVKVRYVLLCIICLAWINVIVCVLEIRVCVGGCVDCSSLHHLPARAEQSSEVCWQQHLCGITTNLEDTPKTHIHSVALHAHTHTHTLTPTS